MLPPQSQLNIRCSNSDSVGQLALTPSQIVHFTHALTETGLFDDDQLIELLDGYPEECIHVTTMPVDATPQELSRGWRVGTVAGLSGIDILNAVQHGQLWLNIKQLDSHAPEYAQLVQHVYREVAGQLHCAVPQWQKATLLISSPAARVYYHADSIPNLLWQLRGQKDVYVYPSGQQGRTDLEHIEQICSGESEEQMPYHAAFEQHAVVFRLHPGQGIMWPQNTPHRVVNAVGLNVSLSTEHITREARRTVNLHRGNRLLRRMGLHPDMGNPNSLSSNAKRLLAVGHTLLHKGLRKSSTSYSLAPTFSVDPNARGGVRDFPDQR